MIGHMKADGILVRNCLEGALGDTMHAILCGAGHNLRTILANLRVLYFALFANVALLLLITPPTPNSTGCSGTTHYGVSGFLLSHYGMRCLSGWP